VRSASCADERFDPDHRAILAAVVNRDAAAARRAVVRHVGALYGEVHAAAAAKGEKRPTAAMLDYTTILGAFT
jgi:DNA-binding GntR family transcriptional regulator